MPDLNCVPGTNIPKPEVRLTDGNAVAIMCRVRQALRRAGVPAPIVEAFRQKALSGDYDNVLSTACEYAEVT